MAEEVALSLNTPFEAWIRVNGWFAPSLIENDTPIPLLDSLYIDSLFYSGFRSP